VPRLKHLVTVLSPRSLKFSPRSTHVGFVLGTDLSPSDLFPRLCSIIIHSAISDDLCIISDKVKQGKAVTAQASYRASRFQAFEAPRFPENRLMKVARLSAPSTSRLYTLTSPPPRKYSWYSFLFKVESKGHNEAARIMSINNSNNTIENRTPNFPACSAVTQPNAPPRAPSQKRGVFK